jgi:nucleotide-binding universal stress UspA family protein
MISLMSAPIVVGFDPEGADEAPLQFGIAAARYTGAPLIVAAVHGGRETDERALDRVSTRLANEAGIRSELRSVKSGNAARVLTEALETEGAGLGVVGATARGAVGRRIVGSTAEHVIHKAPCPVAVVPHGFAGGDLGTVGVAYNPSPEGQQALRSGVVLAQASGAALRVITVLHEQIGTLGSNLPGQRAMQQLPEEVASKHHAAARDAVDAALAEAGAEINAEVELVYGDPAESLLGFTGSLDVLMMGSRAHGPRRAVLLGSVSSRVTAESKCPVVVLPRDAEFPLRDLIASGGGAQPEA